jgi:hypothetical protein
MSLLPTFTQPKMPEWRGNTSSADMNQNFSEILYDLNNIFAEASDIVTSLNELESRIRHDVEAISTRVYAVSGIISSFEQSASGYKMFYEDFYLPKDVLYPTNIVEQDRCVVNDEFGVVTLPVNSSFSKVYTINISDGKAVAAPDLTLELTPIDEISNVKIEGTSETRAFDGNDNTVWERKIRFNRDSTKTNVRCLLTATLPSMSNPYVNKIHIKPYPEGSIDITNITYDTTTSQDIVLPSFPTLGENNSPTKMFSFDNISPIKVKFYLRQRSSKQEDDYKTFVYGAKEFGIEKVEYKPTGKVGIRFDLPDYDTGHIGNITSLVTNPSYDNIIYKVSLYSAESEFNADLPMWTTSNSPITPTNPLDVSIYGLTSLWVMVQLNQPLGDTKTPLLQSVSMTYTTFTT